jgi:hypothetical protein
LGTCFENDTTAIPAKVPLIVFPRHLTNLVVAVATLISIGCGPQSDLLGVTGEVLLDGVPVKSGSIRFTSVGSEKIASTGALIKDGQYEITQARGLPPGTYQIVISAGDENSPQDAGGPGSAVARELIPAEYNVNSDKTVDVAVDGDNHFVFDIKSN